MSNDPDLGWSTTDPIDDMVSFDVDSAAVAAQDWGSVELGTALGETAAVTTAAAVGGALLYGSYVAGSALANEWTDTSGGGGHMRPGMVAGDPNGWWMDTWGQWYNAAGPNPLQAYPYPQRAPPAATPLPAPGSQTPTPPPPSSGSNTVQPRTPNSGASQTRALRIRSQQQLPRLLR